MIKRIHNINIPLSIVTYNGQIGVNIFETIAEEKDNFVPIIQNVIVKKGANYLLQPQRETTIYQTNKKES